MPPADPVTTAATTTAATTSAAPTGPAAASGQQVSLSHIAVNIPAEWGPQSPLVVTNVATVASDGSRYFLSIGQTDLGARDLDDTAEIFNESSLYPTKQKILDDVMFLGQQWFHLAGQVDVRWADGYGTFVGGVLVSVTLETDGSITRKQRDQALASIMASVALKP